MGLRGLKRLPEEEQKKILPYMDAYVIGLQGPDVFFNRVFEKGKKTVHFGEELHELSGRTLFTSLRSDALKDPRVRAYALGFLGHYVLDTIIHPYINEVADWDIARHLAFEMDYDRELLLRRGKKPGPYRLSRHVRTTRATQRAAAEFYAPILKEYSMTKADVRAGIRSMAMIRRLVRCPNRLVEKLLLSAMRKLGFDPMYESMIMKASGPHLGDLPESAFPMSDELMSLAVEDYRTSHEALIRFWEEGRELPRRFDLDFSGIDKREKGGME